MPENTKYVGRPTRWGNPFLVEDLGAEESVKRFRDCLLSNVMCYNYFDQNEANIQFERFKWMSENLGQLRNMDLACFCSIYSPCHADVLIDMLH